MLPAYMMRTGNKGDKYFDIGYKCFSADIPRDLANDLSLTDRASFLRGWDAASLHRKSQDNIKPSLGL